MYATEAIARLNHIAGVLLPGDANSPSATALAELDGLLVVALRAVGRECETVYDALGRLPERPTWDDLRAFSQESPEPFEVMASVVAGAYFMAPEVLDSIGYPHGARRAPRNDLVVDEIESGILEPVLERAPMMRSVL